MAPPILAEDANRGLGRNQAWLQAHAPLQSEAASGPLLNLPLTIAELPPERPSTLKLKLQRAETMNIRNARRSRTVTAPFHHQSGDG